MNKGIYIATLEKQSGKSLITIGLMQLALAKLPKVGYFRPIIGDLAEGEKDNHIETILTHFNLKQTYNTCYGFTESEYLKKVNEGKQDEILDTIISQFKSLEDQYEFVIVEGTDFSGKGSFLEFDFNVLIAKNLGLPAILISSGLGKNKVEFTNSLQLAYNTFINEEVEVLAVVANKIKPKNVALVDSILQELLPKKAEAYVIPRIQELLQPTIGEINAYLKGEVLFGAQHLSNRAGKFKVGAMQLRHFLGHLEDHCLVITPGDRADMILAVLQANISANYPQISGIILTGDLVPEQPILKLIEGLSRVVPMICVEEGTFQVANKIGNIQANIQPDNHSKIDRSIATFQQHIPSDKLLEKLLNFESKVVTPRMFQYSLIQKARKQKKRIVLPEGLDPRILTAVARLSTMDLVDIILLGDTKAISNKISEMGLNIDLEKITLINPVDDPRFEDYANTFYELRKHKNVSLNHAKDIMADVSYFGTMMIYKNDADGMVSGAMHTTQHTIRPALQFIKTKPGVSLVSSIFFMCLDDRVAVFGDCAINPNPNAEELAAIAISSAESSKAFGIEPRIAMLSYSSGASGKGADVDIVREATEIVKSTHPELKVEGPIQYDAAVDMHIGKSKMPDSEVAGQANVLIFPDLNTGNNTYKAVQRETGAMAIGPMLQGLNKPVNDLSRGCTVDDIFNTVVLTAIQAQED
jgi:phosphate acetyltransferase